MRARAVSMSVLRQLDTWSPRTVLPIVEECEARGIDPAEDTPGLLQARDDIVLMQRIEQKQRVLPMPNRST